MEKDFNKNHPERRKDEVFITNSDEGNYHDIGWKTKRPGTVAYTIGGKSFKGSFPVFVKISEIKKAKDGEEILK